jgi:hypothetical protein
MILPRPLPALVLAAALAGCETDLEDRIPPALTVLAPDEGLPVPTGTDVPLRFRATDNEELATWVINVRNERIGNSVWATSGNVSDTGVTVQRSFRAETGLATEFLVEFQVIDAAQNETIEKRRFFEVP